MTSFPRSRPQTGWSRHIGQKRSNGLSRLTMSSGESGRPRQRAIWSHTSCRSTSPIAAFFLSITSMQACGSHRVDTLNQTNTRSSRPPRGPGGTRIGRGGQPSRAADLPNRHRNGRHRLRAHRRQSVVCRRLPARPNTFLDHREFRDERWWSENELNAADGSGFDPHFSRFYRKLRTSLV